MRRSWRAITAIAVTGTSAGLAGMLAGPAHAASATPAAVSPSGTTYSAAGRLDAVAAVSNGSAWAVGSTGGSAPRILMVHWNGTAWSRLTSPGVLTAAGELWGVTVVSSKDAWAVGDTGGSAHPRALVLHWNGAAWSQVASPAASNAQLSGVTATASSGWAVGYYFTGPAAIDYHPLVYRLSGSTWTRLNTSNLGAGVGLGGVVTTSKGTTIAVGDEVGQITGVAARWNGHGWAWDTSVPYRETYEAIAGIAAGPGGTAFTVGWNGNNPATPPLSMKWTGQAWLKAPVSAPSSATLNAVTFAPGGTGWAAGQVASYPAHSLIVRWNGTTWTRVTSPAGATLNGIGFSAAGYGWAVGDALTSSGTSRTFITHWNGHAWG
jgi:hypothetical protein